MVESKPATSSDTLSSEESSFGKMKKPTNSENIREIGALTEILRDELMTSLGVHRMVLLTMTKEGPMVIRQDPRTGNIYQLPISLQSSIRSLLS